MPLSSGSKCPRTVGLHDPEDEGTAILWDTDNCQAAHLDISESLTVNTTAVRTSNLTFLMLHSMVIEWWYPLVCQHVTSQH
jgi:hypothetical protein